MIDVKLRNTPLRYGAMALTIHWLTVALVLIAWLLGIFGDALPRGAARAGGLLVHIWAGLAVLSLLVARVAWRIGDAPPPPEPTVLGAWGEHAARIGHFALYALLAAVPLVGIAVQFGRGRPLSIFGLFEIASPWVADRAFARSAREVHELLAHALVILAALHAAAALVHHWLLRDRTLKRMLPRWGGLGLS